MNRGARTFALVCVFTVFASVAATAWGTAPGKNGDLVFRRYFDKSHSWGALFVADPSGARVRQITNPKRGVLDNVPDWSPDGRRIAFQRVDPNGCGAGCETDDIYVVRSDGTQLTRVAYDTAGKGCVRHGSSAGGICRNAPAWSADGKLIAFSCDSLPKGEDVCVMNATGSDLRQLEQTPEVGVSDEWPQWSPDGTQIVVQRVLGKKRALFVTKSDGTAPRRLTPWALRGGEPDWSPDGTRIVLTSNQNGPGSISANLFTIRPDGTALTQLTHARGGSVQYLSASFSPDGKWLTVSRTPGAGKDGNADVYVMHADGTGLRPVTRTARWDSSTDWGSR